MPTPASFSSPYRLQCRDRELDCRPGTVHVMGILNVTPDSFSDGGAFFSVDDAVHRACEMVKEGADVIDIGGESTRPGSTPVEEKEELKRVVPVVKRISLELPNVLISVDTYKPHIAREALAAGAHMVNDVTGLRLGTGVAEAVAEAEAGLIVMHSTGTPGSLTQPATYDDVLADVIRSLRQSIDAAEQSGIQSLVVDAGFGFGKSHEENLRLVAETDSLQRELDRPVLVGVSRKSTIGAVLGSESDPAPVDRRLFGSLGLAALAIVRGASILRVHDVGPTVELVRIITAAEKRRPPLPSHSSGFSR